MTDAEFITAFEACTLAADQFKHRGHLRITWIYLHKYPLERAISSVTQGIKRYATHLGAAHIYHETMTIAWVHVLHAAGGASSTLDFDEFIAATPQVFDKNLLSKHYSSAVLNSEKARQEWVAPDLKPIV
jgi:hypothetical protein